ncbi:DUF484 family protein [Ectothiorhodospiraceae bacterium 2226]|nr:DUF484 family protein [Ectothiorhodospiraceae bacterium 2226]
MSSKPASEPATAAPPIGDKEVVRYLRQTPDFFARHSELLTELTLPHAVNGKAVSLIEHQVAILQEQRTELKRRLDGLLAIAAENDRLHSRLHEFTLLLLGARGPRSLIDALSGGLQRLFEAEPVVLLAPARPAHPELAPRVQIAEPDSPAHQWYTRVLKGGVPVCGYLQPEQVQYVFGRERSTAVASAALVPLVDGERTLALLALPSPDAERFNPRKSTDFIAQLGRLIARGLAPYWS